MWKFGLFARVVFPIMATVLWIAPPVDAVPVTNGLIARWSGDGDAADGSGNGHHGTLSNGAAFDAGLLNQAFRLDGFDDYVDFNAPSSLLLSGTSFTISTWVNFSASADPANTGGIVQRYSHSGGAWGLLRTKVGKLWFALDTNGLWGPARVVESTFTPDLDRWYHVAGVYDHFSGDAKLYIDGSLDNTTEGPPITVYPGASTVSIGNWYNFDGTGSAHSMPGLVDEVAVYNRSLSYAEIGLLAAIPEPTTALLLGIGLIGLSIKKRTARA